MNKSLLLLLFLLCLNGNLSAQKDDLVFRYLEEKVRRVKMSWGEYINMTYQDGLIIGKEYRNGPLVERRFYYTKPGKLDSVLISRETGSVDILSSKYYRYDQGEKLEQVKTFVDHDKEMYDLKLFSYDDKGRVDSIMYWRNYSVDAFMGKAIIPLRLVEVSKLSYDTIGRLIKSEYVPIRREKRTEEYAYDDQGRVNVVTAKYRMPRGRGVTVTEFKYNKRGLRTRESSRIYSVNESGERKLFSKGFSFRWKYAYYD